jgi:hypothetical protein
LLFSARPREDAKAKEEFRFLTPRPAKPSELAAEMYRSWSLGGSKVVLAPVTMIHANRITKITCDVKGNTAKGVVSFEVPKLYAGQVDYVARKIDGTWRIVEFAMPAQEIRVVLGENGKWKEKPAQDKPVRRSKSSLRSKAGSSSIGNTTELTPRAALEWSP